jgi:hypothetical protein
VGVAVDVEESPGPRPFQLTEQRAFNPNEELPWPDDLFAELASHNSRWWTAPKRSGPWHPMIGATILRAPVTVTPGRPLPMAEADIPVVDLTAGIELSKASVALLVKLT